MKSWGFIADSATDGEDALEKVTTFRPSIIRWKWMCGPPEMGGA